MKLRVLLLFALLLIAAQEAPSLGIVSPKPGEIVRGQVTIVGTMNVPGFMSAELDFAYAAGPGWSWFRLQTYTQPPADSTLLVWDTAGISDGEYVLRLLVSLADGTTQETTVPIRIQNDTPLPTATPRPTATPVATEDLGAQIPTPFLLAASPTPTEVPRPTPTPLPANPVALDRAEIYTSLGRGALVILGLFALAGILLRLRRP